MSKGFMPFEDYLQEVFMDTYSGDKEDFRDSFEDWMDNLTRYEIVDYADKWGKMNFTSRIPF